MPLSSHLLAGPSRLAPAVRPLRRLGAALLALTGLLLPATAAAQPSERAVNGLLHDLKKIVEVQQSLGWKIDKYELEEMIPDALLSVCRASEDIRSAAATEIEARVDALGGPVEDAFHRNNGSLSGLGELMFMSRVRTLLAEATRRAPAECPFWMKPEPDFQGLQLDAHRFTLSVEGGGLFMLQHVGAGHFEIGAGGSGRLLLGRGLDEHWSLLAGPELGLGALFDQTETGTNFPIQFAAAVPVVLRHHDISWHYDFELAPVGFFTWDNLNVSYGARVGFLLGVSTLRVRRIMPWAGLGVSAEYLFANEARGALQNVRGGVRVGFDWDF